MRTLMLIGVGANLIVACRDCLYDDVTAMRVYDLHDGGKKFWNVVCIYCMA